MCIVIVDKTERNKFITCSFYVSFGGKPNENTRLSSTKHLVAT